MNAKHKRRITLLLLLALTVCLLSGCGLEKKTAADLIVYGDIYTADEAGNAVKAFAVKDGKYIYVGDADGAKAYIGSDTQIIQAGFVMPSAVETHSHYILEEAFKLGFYIDCCHEDGTGKTLDEIAREALAYREMHPELTGIYGYGWDKFVTEGLGEAVTREKLDEYISDIPVYISGRDLHSGWCNTKCLEIADALYNEIPTEGVVRGEDGTATGMIRDQACSYVRNSVFGGVGNYDEAVQNASSLLLSRGYTMLLDPWSNFDGTTEMVEAVKRAYENDSLPMVVFTSWCVDTYDDYDEEISAASEVRKETKTARADMKFIKLFCDGTEDAMTAYLLEPYSDGSFGTDNWTPEQMTYVTAAANAAGLLVHTHTYGDASARQTIDAYEASNQVNGEAFRNSLAHAPYVADSDLERIAELGIGVAGSGNWCTSDTPEDAEYYNEILGSERYYDYYIVDKWVEYGCKAGMSTDRPCIDGYAEDVFDYIGVLTTGSDYREGCYMPAKRDKYVSVEDAIRMMTINGAWSLDADTERGSIEVGKYADFIIADGNPFETELSEIHAINVLQTWFEGLPVYDRQ